MTPIRRSPALNGPPDDPVVGESGAPLAGRATLLGCNHRVQRSRRDSMQDFT